MTDKIEIEGKFGPIPSSNARTSRAKLAKVLRFYRSPEGQRYLKEKAEEEVEFRRVQKDMGIETPLRFPVDVDGFRLVVREVDAETGLPVSEEEVLDEEDG